MEEFRFFNEHVLVSNFGRVSFLKYPHTTFGNLMSNGYLRIKINQQHYYIHRLVWQMFRGDIPDGYIVHHIDGNKQNNHLDNLCLMKSEEHKKMHNTGENSHFYGKHFSEEHKLKLSESLKGKKNCLGYKQTIEHIHKRVESKKRNAEIKKQIKE